jgi:hypothetical protein
VRIGPFVAAVPDTHNLESKLNSTFHPLCAIIAVAALAGSPHATAGACSVSDVSFTINSTLYTPSKCVDGIAQQGGPAAETSALNAALATGGFGYLDKSDDPSTPIGIDGVRFVIGAGTGNSGSWTMSWSEQPGLPNLPLFMDFALGLFGGGHGSGYFFDNVRLSDSATTASGSYDINFVNHGGREVTLGHLLLAGGNVESAESNARISVSAVPEPATFALLGLGLAAVAFMRRRYAGANIRPAKAIVR